MNSFDMLGWEGIFLIATGSIAFIGLMKKTYGANSQRKSLTPQLRDWLSHFHSIRLPKLHVLLNSHQVMSESQDSKSLSL